MDGFFAPAAFGLLALAIPILITYMLRARRPQRLVSSTFLWREATQNVAATKPWQRLRFSILLLLQLLVLIALVVMLARPYVATEGVAGTHLVLVVDASGSMLATDDPPSRIESARTAARRLLDTLGPGGVASVISAGPQPAVVVSNSESKGSVRRALEAVKPSEGEANFSEAFLLAESLETAERPATIALITDGGLTREEQALIPPGAVVRQVGRRASNVAVTRLDVAEGPSGFTAFVSVRNFGPNAITTDLRIAVDNTPLTTSSLRINGGAAAEKSFQVGATTGRLTATISSSDSLAADDRAFAVLERTHPHRIHLATPGNLFLEQLLKQLPGAVVEVGPEAKTGEGFDLVVIDRVAVPEKLAAPALFVAPASAPAGVTANGKVESPLINFVAAEDPLLENVDLSDLAVKTAERVALPSARTLVGASDATAAGESFPLIAVWADGARRRAWIGFDLHHSNLPLQVAFPIMGDHLLSYLTGADKLSARVAGDPIDVGAPPGTTEIRIERPEGGGTTVEPGSVYTGTDRTGFYKLTFLEGDEVLAERTLALSFPASESNLLPRGVQAKGSQGRPGLIEAARRPTGAIVLALALLLLMLEWWWAHGRPLPGIPRRHTPEPAPLKRAA